MYIVRKRPNGEVIARCETFRDAMYLQSIQESHDLEFDVFEPDTYYINEVIVDD